LISVSYKFKIRSSDKLQMAYYLLLNLPQIHRGAQVGKGASFLNGPGFKRDPFF
jgi:hypothetical protein